MLFEFILRCGSRRYPGAVEFEWWQGLQIWQMQSSVSDVGRSSSDVFGQSRAQFVPFQDLESSSCERSGEFKF